MTTVEERVQAGAALLDEVLPDWWNGKDTPTIELRLLDLNSTCMCVLGQCYGDYKAGCDKLGITAYGEGAAESEAFPLGFLDLDHEPLTEAWRAEIERRRKAAGHA